MNELDLDKFGEIMDEFLKKNEIQMLLTMPKGSNECHIKDNIGLGGVVHFYILLSGIGRFWKRCSGIWASIRNRRKQG